MGNIDVKHYGIEGIRGDPTGKHYRIRGVLLYLGYGGSYSEFRQEKGGGGLSEVGEKGGEGNVCQKVGGTSRVGPPY